MIKKKTESNRSLGLQGTAREVGHGEYVDHNIVFYVLRLRILLKALEASIENLQIGSL